MNEILAEQRATVRAAMSDAVQNYIDSKGSVAAAAGTSRGVRLVPHKNLTMSPEEVRAVQSRGSAPQVPATVAGETEDR